MATNRELSQYTYEELSKMQLSYADMGKKSNMEILTIAAEKLERFKSLAPEQQGTMAKVVPLLEAVLVGVSANLLTDAVRAVDWQKLLTETLQLLDQLMP